MSFYSELKRRNVFRVAIAYLALAWLLTEVASTLFPVFGIPDWGVRLLVILLVLGFLPALVFSWIYELTPEGIKREQDVVREVSIARLTARRLDLLTIGIVLAALAFILVDRVWRVPGEEVSLSPPAAIFAGDGEKATLVATGARYPSNSIVVLPFLNMSADADNEYFSDGISEELLNLLAKVPELRVISRSSAFYFKGKDIKTSEIARELKVAHVLEGSVRKAGDRVRITAQLIEAETDTHLWSETYDRRLDDIFAVQDEIAATVVAELKPTLLNELPRSESVDPDAYTLYLQAVYAANEMGPAAMERSNTFLKQALSIQPAYARAWRLLARNYDVQTSLGILPKTEGRRLTRQAIDEALANDPNLAEAHSWLAAKTAQEFGGDLVSAAERLRRAVALEPTNPVVLSHAAAFMRILGRLDEAIEIQEYVVTLDPLGPINYDLLTWSYLNAGRSGDALSAVTTLRTLSPNYGGLNTLEGLALLQNGDYEGALSAILKEPREFWRLVNLVKAYYRAGQADLSDVALSKLTKEYGAERAYWIASALAYRNEVDRSLEWLERAIQTRDSRLHFVLTDAAFNNCREDPRWISVLHRLGKSPEQLAAIKFDVELPH